MSIAGDITLNSVGHVRVTLRDASGALVGGAHVLVSSSSPFAGVLSGTTASDGGAAVFSSVLAGTITARATHPVSGLLGETTGLLVAGATLDLATSLQPTGRIAGTVLRREGGVAAGVTVTLSQPRSQTTTTAMDGRFAFEDTPLGTWSLTVSDGVTGDIGQASGVLATAGTTANADVTLNGVGTVRVTVRDAGGAVVPGASVTVTSSAGRAYPATTDGAGLGLVANVLAGSISATAVHATNGTRGAATGTLAPAGQLDLSIALQATGTIRGRVLAPDGVTPVSGVLISGVGAPTTTAADGRFELAEVPLGSYALSATVAGRLRAQVAVALTANGQILDQDLTLVGAAPVRGRVTDAGGSPAAGAQISLHSLAATYGGFFGATTAVTGDYEVLAVPLGAFDVSAARGADRASAGGTVASDGALVTVDLTLLPSAVALPLSLTDANGFQWQIARDGTLNHSLMLIGPETGSRLTVIRAGVATSFAGPDCTPTCTAATEEGQREVVLPQSGVAGLEVTRKVYVARDGYFARHLDVVRNPGPDPVTIDLSFASHLGASSLLSSSSGDAVYGSDDRWITVDDSDATDPYDTANPYWNFWPLGVVTSGAGGQAPSAVTSTVAPDGGRILTETWSGVTLSPGQSLGLLRFQTPQVDRVRAQAAAERLAQLPPEALVGLTPEEGASVRNFVVPAGLASAVASLPPNDGVVTGRVLAGDGQTPAGQRPVVFRSRSLYFGRPLTVEANGVTGAFQVTGHPTSSDVLPRAAFDLSSSAQVFGPRTASASGDFPLLGEQPASSSTVDLVYHGTGVIDAQVTRADASPLAGVSLSLSDGMSSLFASGDATGHGRFVLLPPGAFTISARLPNGPEQSLPVTAIADQKVTLPVIFADLGAVEGTLRTAAGQPVQGTVAIDVPGGFTRTANADAATGHYRLSDVPFGSYTVQATDAFRSGAVVAASTTVTGALSVVDFQFPPVGRVNVTVRVGSATGGPLASAPVRWKADARGPDYIFYGYTSSIGQLSIPFVAGPQFRVRAEHPANVASFGESALTAIAEGQTVDVTVVVPGVGTVAGTLRSRDGVPQPGQYIVASAATSSDILGSAFADAAGAFTMPNVPVGPLRLVASCQTIYRSISLLGKAEVDATVPSNGTTVAQDALCPMGAVTPTRRRDFWTFSAAAGDPIRLTLAPGEGATPLADPYLEVYEPGGPLAAANDNRDAADKAGAVDFVAPMAGTYVVVARAAGTQSGGYRLGDQLTATIPTLRTYEPPRVAGVVKKDWDQSLVVGQALRLVGGGTAQETVVTPSDGSFSLGVFPLGAFTLEAIDEEGVVVARATGSSSTPGAVVAQDVVVPARGTVSVTVHRGPQPLAAVPVIFTSDHVGALDEDRVRIRTTAVTGSVTTTLPTGAVTARVTDPLYGGSYEASGALVDGATLVLELPLPENVSRVFGTVASGEGSTLLPGAIVTLVGPTTFQTVSDAAGRYEIAAVPPGTYTLAASLGGGSVSQPLTLTGGDRQADLRLAIPVIKGRITEPDGATAALATVQLCQSSICVSQNTRADGTFAFLGDLPAWATNAYVFLRAWPVDNANLIASSSFVYLPAVVVTLDVSLPASRVVFGMVRTAEGSPAAAEVRLRDNYTNTPLAQTTGPDGSYRFTHVALFGSVDLFALSLADGLPARASSPEEYVDVQLDLTLPAAASFSGVLLDPVGQPRGSVAFAFEAPDIVAEDGYSRWTRTIPVDESGQFATVVPAGPFRAVYDAAACSDSEPREPLLAVADGRLASGANPP